jgi:hypothetical protein
VIVARVDQGCGQGLPAFDYVIKADLGAQSQKPRQHRPGEVAVDQNGAMGTASQSTRQREHESRPAFRSMAACEEEDFHVLMLPRLQDELRHPFESIAPLALQAQNDLRPL